jgi:nicotinate-nucleotide adenylyltransferase
MKNTLLILSVLLLNFGCARASKHAGQEIRVGIFTGTFDPPHLGHVDIARRSADQLKLDHVYVIPNHSTPHKPNASSFADRNEMSRMAFDSDPRFVLADDAIHEARKCTMDIDKVLENIKARYPDRTVQFYRVKGDDSMDAEMSGKYPLIPNMTYIVGARSGKSAVTGHQRAKTGGSEWIELYILGGKGPVISSTAVREQIRQGKRPQGVSDKVLDYALVHGLYDAQKAKKVMGDWPECNP